MFTIALNFEDGITRFIQCNAGEKVLDAGLPTEGQPADGLLGRRLRDLQMPLRQRRLWHGEEYLEEALSEEEADARQVLTCQMIPTSDCVIDVPVCCGAVQNRAGQHRCGGDAGESPVGERH
ncbi:2-halobenzoate 1,2-dioxygenase electron transfer component [Raoultella planticola]|uniref:2-halobenzoate 1,2-dioxygenase electron transfer component n=1 Tax=Raoultella planticola TaxID=575 RepID=A0A485D2D8_RAOPL|nr:2-halobenzoate 1,2-dioxygenase electron transfer component [Raoultella planticola]